MTDWDEVINNIDGEYLQEALHSTDRAMTKAICLKKEKEMKSYRIFGRRMVHTLLAAALIMAMMTTVAFAADIFGIRKMLESSGQKLTEQAEADIIRHLERRERPGWDCTLTESLSDASNVLMTITVTSEDEYVIVPTDADPNDPVSDIGISGDKTLTEYAKEQGKKLLKVGAGIADMEELGINLASMSFENISDGEMVILIDTKKSGSSEITEAVCVVTALEQGCGADDIQRVELPFSFKESAVKSSSIYFADEAAVISGIEFDEAAVQETALGLNIEMPITVVDEDAFDNNLKFEFEGISYDDGGFLMDDDGKWTGRYSMCTGSVGEELKVLVYDLNKQVIGEVTFIKQK